MRIAVTGGGGFLGSNLVRRLVEEGHQVRALDIAPPEIAGADSVQADVELFEAVRANVVACDIVYHLAGPVLEGARRSPWRATRLQQTGTVNVLEACRQAGVGRVVVASSFYVYDGIDPSLIVNEATPVEPYRMELFGSLKLGTELVTREFSRKYGLDYVLLRFGSAYGVGNSSNVIKTFLEAGLRGEPIEVWGAGKRRNQYTYVDDIVEGCVAALNANNETFNLISPEETTTGQLADLLREEHGFDVVLDPTRPEGASMPYMDARKAMSQLTWRPRPLRDGVRAMIRRMDLLASSFPERAVNGA